MDLKHHQLAVNGIQMHVAEQGTGPLVVMCHGWPELWYSWRHQLAAIAKAGFRAVAPDMRGFGRTEAPAKIEDFTLLHNVGDIVGLVSALGESKAIVIGHDWGAPVAWTAAMMRPDVFPAVCAMSVPHRPRSAEAPLKTLKQAGLGNYYWIYFQQPGVAEGEFERDVSVTLRKLLYGVSGDVPIDRENPLVIPEGQGFLDRMAVAPSLPAWLREEDLKTMIGEYQRTGFRGGLNWYRNIDRNWELTAPWHNATIQQPALFIAGTRDPVIAGKRGQIAIDAMTKVVPGVKKVLLDGAGHWVQQERPQEVNAAVLEFLNSVRSRVA
jgi:pimeloyl-ACP methyl ester carboxylesterase